MCQRPSEGEDPKRSVILLLSVVGIKYDYRNFIVIISIEIFKYGKIDLINHIFVSDLFLFVGPIFGGS